MINKLVRPNIRNLQPYSSARSLYQTGVFYDANENALGSVVKLPGYPELNRYPDPYSRDLRKALANYVKVDPKNVFVGNGADEAIDLLIRVFVNPDEEILVLEPTYGMYRVSADTAGVAVRACQLDETFQIDVKKVFKTVSKKTKLLFCCSPNNPTGTLLREKDIRTLCRRFKGIVVLDEAYIEFAPDKSMLPLIRTFPNLVVLRTLSKAWGLAGLRVGYCVADKEIIDYLDKVKAPYNLNCVTSAIAVKALKKKQQMRAYRRAILRERTRLVQRLSALGFRIFPTEANFILVQYPGMSGIAKTLAETYGLIIRDFGKKPRLKDCARISIGIPAENNLLLNTLKKIL